MKMAISIGNMVIDQWIEGSPPLRWAAGHEDQRAHSCGRQSVGGGFGIPSQGDEKPWVSPENRWKKQFGILGNGSVSKPIVPL